MHSYDIAIVGGGIVGAACFYKIQKKYPKLSIALFEKEDRLAAHQTGHNSGVIHSGLYYKPGSLKAKNCFAGRHEIVEFAKKNGIKHDVCGKIIVATNSTELERMENIYRNGVENKIEGIRKLSSEQIKEIEPFVEGIAGIHVPVTGIIDFVGAAKKMVELALAINKSSALHLKSKVESTSFDKELQFYTIYSSTSKFKSKYIVYCGGLQADRLAKKSGIKLKERVVPFRGDYYELTDDAKHKVKNLIYPVPDPNFPFLGVNISGGHTQIVLCKDYFEMEIIGETLDDSIGEAYDKCGKMMGLNYPAGPKIDEFARNGNPTKFKFSIPKVSGLDFSFSGLKTNFKRFIEDKSSSDKLFIQEEKENLCSSLQETITKILVDKIIQACKNTGIKNIVFGGGVSANSRIRESANRELKKFKLFFPKIEYTTDNAAMIAIVGYLKYKAKKFTNYNVESKARYDI